MPTIKFTAISVKNFKQGDYIDSLPPRTSVAGQLGIRIGKKAKAWYVRYRASDKHQRLKIGMYPDMSLSDAREKAAEELGKVFGGYDPAEAKTTMMDLWEEYQKTSKYKGKAHTTRSGERIAWGKYIKPTMGDHKLQDVTPYIISKLLDRVSTDKPVAANRLYSFMRVLFKPALAKGWIDTHPMQWIDKPNKEIAKERCLSEDEIALLWPHIDNLRVNPRDALKLGLLTAQRPGEISQMRWENVDFEKGIWTIPKTKTGNTHLVPLSKQVVKILKDRQLGIGYTKKTLWMIQDEYVFPTRHNGSSTYIKATLKARRVIQEASGVVGWTAHDLRRTGRTIMAQLKVAPHIAERVLNHSVGGIQKVYDQYGYIEETREALDLLGAEIDRIVKEKS